MEINAFSVFKPNNGSNYTEKPNSRYPNLAPLKQDTVSFKGSKSVIKKSDFKGIDAAIIEMYRINISGFKSTDDLQEWAKEKIKKDYAKKDFSSRQPSTTKDRKKIFAGWYNYVTKENDTYTPTMQLMILNAITKDLKSTNDVLPPALNKGVLADTMTEVVDKLENNPTEKVNLAKIYKTRLKASYLGSDSKNSSDYTGWIVIPSKKHDPINFNDNVEKLKTLSHRNWCTKSFNARPYLSDGDFHVYMKNGEPKIGVRFYKDKIQEIQGEKNNSEIPQLYFDMVKSYIKDNNLNLHKYCTDQIERAEETKVQFEEIKAKIGEEDLKNNNPEKILPYFGIKVKKDADGMYIISEYRQPVGIHFEDFGIDENKMFKNIKAIKGTGDFEGTSLNSLHNLKFIGGNANFRFTNIKSLGNLETINGNLEISESLLEDLGKLKFIGKNVDFNDTYIENPGELECIGGNAKFKGSHITSLGKLKTVCGNLLLADSEVYDLGNIEEVGKNANLSHTQIKTLGKLRKVGKTLDLKGSEVKDLGELREVGQDLDLSYTDVKSIGNLKLLNGSVILNGSLIDEEEFYTQLYGDDFIETFIDESIGNDDAYMKRLDRAKAHYKSDEEEEYEPNIWSMEDFERYLENQ